MNLQEQINLQEQMNGLTMKCVNKTIKNIIDHDRNHVSPSILNMIRTKSTHTRSTQLKFNCRVNYNGSCSPKSHPLAPPSSPIRKSPKMKSNVISIRKSPYLCPLGNSQSTSPYGMNITHLTTSPPTFVL